MIKARDAGSAENEGVAVRRCSPGAPSEGVSVMDGDATIRSDRNVATLLEEGDGLVDPNARGADQRRQITLCQG
jgi:hypothetical protein